MNIIYDVDKENLRLISFNPYQNYQLDELRFYISKEKNISPFLLIEDSHKDREILKLVPVNSDNNYYIYTVAPEASLSIEDNNCVISIIGIAENNFIFSNSQLISLSFDNFQLGSKLCLIDELSRNVIVTYKQIEELTKMNIDLYQEIKKEANK
jgi:hypothetical protein